MEATQLLDSALDESETHYYSAEEEDERNYCPKKLIGILKIEENDQEYDIFQGDTISIGRDPENCNIVQENKVSRIFGSIDFYDKCQCLFYNEEPLNE